MKISTLQSIIALNAQEISRCHQQCRNSYMFINQVKTDGGNVPSHWYDDVAAIRKVIVKLARNQKELKQELSTQLNHRQGVNKLSEYIYDDPFGKMFWVKCVDM